MAEQTDKKETMKVEIKGMMLCAAGLFLLLALASFKSDDLTLNSYSTEGVVHNFGGRIGAELADLLLQMFGLTTYAVPISLLYLAYRSLRFKEFRWRFY